MISDTIQTCLADWRFARGIRPRYAVSSWQCLQNVWAARKKLDGRCDYRKSAGNPSKRSLSQAVCRRESWVTNSTSPALTGKLRVSGKQKLSMKRVASERWSSSFLNYVYGVGV